MSTTLQLYIFTRIDALIWMISACFFASLMIAFVVSIIGFFTDMDDDKKTTEKLAVIRRGAVKILIPAAILGVLVPSQKDIAIIYGGSIVAELAQTKEASETGRKLYAVVQKQLDALLTEDDK